MSFDFDAFLKALEGNLKTFAKAEFEKMAKAALADAKAFVDDNKADIEDWSRQAAATDIDPDDVEANLRGLADDAELTALTAAGLEEAELERFRKGIVGVIVDTLKKFI